MGLSKAAIIGLSVAVGIFAVALAAGIPLVIIFFRLCGSGTPSRSEAGQQVGGIPLASKVPRLTEEEKKIKETALRRYKRRLRRDAQAERRTSRGERIAAGDGADERQSESEESTVSEDTNTTISTVASTMVYGRAAYDHESRCDSLARSASYMSRGSASGRQRQKEQRRRRRLHAEERTAGQGGTWEVAFDDDTDTGDTEKDVFRRGDSETTPAVETTRGHEPQWEATPPSSESSPGRRVWTRDRAARTLQLSGFFADRQIRRVPDKLDKGEELPGRNSPASP